MRITSPNDLMRLVLAAVLALSPLSALAQQSAPAGLPPGGATAAAQATGNSSLSTIVTNTGSIVTNTAAGATAANQTTANTSLSTIVTNTTGAATAANQATANTSLSTVATNTTKPSITSFGKLSLTNASTRLSTATVGPGSASWPANPAIVDVTNDPISADTIYACPVGSTPTCTTATGVPIYVGQTFRFYQPSTTMTLIATSTATVEVQF